MTRPSSLEGSRNQLHPLKRGWYITWPYPTSSETDVLYLVPLTFTQTPSHIPTLTHTHIPTLTHMHTHTHTHTHTHSSQSTPSISHSFVQQFAKASRSRSLSPKWDSTSRSSDMKSSISLEQFTGLSLYSIVYTLLHVSILSIYV